MKFKGIAMFFLVTRPYRSKVDVITERGPFLLLGHPLCDSEAFFVVS